MGRHLVFDIETKMKHEELRKDLHILEQLDDEILSLCIEDFQTGEKWSCTDHLVSRYSIEHGLKLLMCAERIIGHNICGFDIPAIQKIYPDFITTADLFDTMLMSQLIYPELIITDYKRKGFPKQFIGRHSLKAWGHRLTNFKTDYTGNFLAWSQEMQDYCDQDVAVTVSLYRHLLTKNYSEKAIIMEGKFQSIITKQTVNGIHFDTEKAEKLYQEIKAELDPVAAKIKAMVPDWLEKSEFTPKRDNKNAGYEKGVTIIREKHVPFNPNSRPQIVKFLKERYSWKPKVFTDTGNPKIDHEVMESLVYPEAELFADFLVRKALMSKLKDAKGGWINLTRNGKIHGKVNTIGTRTRRCSHNSPNLGQIPAPGKYKGEECRELFYAPKGWKIVGCDQSAIQLRVLSHYLAPYDGGHYGRILLESDIHTANQEAAGLPTRPDAKRFIYAFLFGAGDALLGSQLKPGTSESIQQQTGKQLRNKFLQRTQGVQGLLNDVKRAHKRGYIKLIDGGVVPSVSEHTALNTLLQGTDAVICKTWNVIIWDLINERDLYDTCKQVLSVHDEVQFIVKEEYTEVIGELMKEAAQLAGEQLGFRLPTDGAYDIGQTWKDTH